MFEISIIIPSYNSASYLPQAIKSCVDQSYRSFEVIVVNDGSTDNTNAIVAEFKVSYPEIDIILLVKPNGGLVSARKFGVKHARGKYVFFLDADDKISSDALQLLYNQSKGHDIIIGDFILENQRGDLLPIQHKNRKVFYNNEHAVLCDYLSKSISASLCGRLIRKELLNDFSTPDDITTGEDFITNLIIAKNFPDLKISIINEPLYHYVQYGNSMINSVSDYALSQRVKYIKWVINNVSNNVCFLDETLCDTLAYFVLEEYYSYLRDGGNPRFDEQLYKDVFLKFWNKKALAKLRGWRRLLLSLYKYSPLLARILRYAIYKIRLILK